MGAKPCGRGFFKVTRTKRHGWLSCLPTGRSSGWSHATQMRSQLAIVSIFGATNANGYLRRALSPLHPHYATGMLKAFGSGELKGLALQVRVGIRLLKVATFGRRSAGTGARMIHPSASRKHSYAGRDQLPSHAQAGAAPWSRTARGCNRSGSVAGTWAFAQTWATSVIDTGLAI